MEQWVWVVYRGVLRMKIIIVILVCSFLLFTLPFLSASVTKTVNYTFTDTTNNKAYNGTNNVAQTRLTFGGEVNAANYTNLRTMDNNNATAINTAGTNDYLMFRFTFDLNQTAATINQLNITFRGAETTDDTTIRAFVYNWTGNTWTNISTALTAAQGMRFLNLTTETNITDHLGDLNDNVTIVVDNTGSVLADAGEQIRVDYIGINVSYTDNGANWSNNMTNSTLAGTTINHSVNWTDDFALNTSIFSLDNGNGSFLNYTIRGMIGTANQSNFSYVINSTADSTIRWMVYANDSSNNFNVTDTFQYTTTSAASDSCSCPAVNNDWTIINGDQCTLTAACNIGTGTFRVMSGALRINTGGALNANHCFVNSGSNLFILNGAKLTCR